MQFSTHQTANLTQQTENLTQQTANLRFLFFAHMPTSPAFSIPAHLKEKAHALRRLEYSG